MQLTHTVPQAWHYERGYWYRSGTNEQMVRALRDVVDDAGRMVDLRAGDVVVDIGSNDGTLLRMLPPQARRIGFDPATNLRTAAEDGGNTIVCDFFPPARGVGSFVSTYGKAKAVFAVAMFYDLDDPNAFLRAVKACLATDGVFVVQMAYAPAMVRTNDVGNVSHEHLCYYDVQSFAALVEKHALHIAKVQFNDVNGGSFRCFITHGRGGISTDPVAADWPAFARRVAWNKKTTLQMLRSRAAAGETIAGYGASTRGNTILQAYGIGPDLVPYIADRNPDKWGKRTVGSGIPIISEEEMRRRKPAWLFCLPFHFIEAFQAREPDYRGRWIVPLPQPHVQ